MEPNPIDVARGAQTEADHLLAKLAEGYVTFGAGDPEAEVIRALVDSVNVLASVLSSLVNDVSVAVENVVDLFATAAQDDDA